MKKVRYSYLAQQFADPSEIFDELRKFLPTGQFTLGRPVAEFERRFAELIGTKYAVGVGSGTDSLKLPLKAIGVGHGDEVITAANTFIATAGAINEVGARPVFVDCDDSFCMDVNKVEAAITPRTKALMPVHFTGYMTDMRKLMPIAQKHGLPVVEDACQAILADIEGRKSGTWGIAGGFSLHPLKNLNVWGDGGIIVTNDDDVATTLRLLRNHGLINRDEIEIFGYNSRLDSVQAIVGNWLIKDVHQITARRIENAAHYDANFKMVPQIRVPDRPSDCKRVFHLYIVFAERRDELFKHCLQKGIDAKIHYPIPLYRQKALAHLGYKSGDFPIADRHAKEIISFPCDQHLDRSLQDYVIATVSEFYGSP
jgi:dTDP-3-amino-2,3,6-trideoxy-4-keto-D-glucose/dTDP-3-amino-3,4,6-trideoxy-alpha-D-glucose/dTDP-2,6-dideoxy-D-kanosamine transaminase